MDKVDGQIRTRNFDNLALKDLKLLTSSRGLEGSLCINLHLVNRSIVTRLFHRPERLEPWTRNQDSTEDLIVHVSSLAVEMLQCRRMLEESRYHRLVNKPAVAPMHT